MISAYTAILAAFLTVEKVVYPINSAEDLSMQSRIEYGCLGSGSTRAFFKDSNITIFKRMWQFMQSRPHVFMSSNKDGRNRVEKGSYAYLMESASIEYIIERNCNLTQIGGLLDTKGYGIATRKSTFLIQQYLPFCFDLLFSTSVKQILHTDIYFHKRFSFFKNPADYICSKINGGNRKKAAAPVWRTVKRASQDR